MDRLGVSAKRVIEANPGDENVTTAPSAREGAEVTRQYHLTNLGVIRIGFGP
jgi:hypothetical protein